MRLILVFLCFLGLSLPLVGWAQPTDPKEEAAEVFKEADARFRKKDYEGALEGYQKAYDLSKEPLLLFNIGQCYSNLKRYQEAIGAYQRFLTEAPDSRQKPLAESLIKENQEKLDKVAKTQPIETTQPVASTQSTPASTQKTDGTEPPTLISKLPPPKIFYLGAAASGGLGLSMGVIAFGAARQARGIQKDPQGDNTQIAQPFQRARTLSHVADVFFVLAIASGGAGYWLSQQEETSAVSASLSAAGLSLTIKF